MIEIRPQPGPQTAFMSTGADIAIFGGAAGGGKSYALLLKAAQYTHVPGYSGIVFRREAVQLTGGGSLWEESQGLYPLLGGVPRESPQLEWRFPTRPGAADAVVEFRHLQHDKHKLAHQGKAYAFLGFDELTHFDASQFWYLLSRARSTCGVTPFVRATCNPDPDSFVRQLIDWWIGEDGRPISERSGALRWFVRRGDSIEWADSREDLAAVAPGGLPMSLTFIPSRLEDNPALTAADPTYRARLEALPFIERARLLDQNWDIRPVAGNVFRRGWFRVVEEDDPVVKDVVSWVRAYDLAGTEANAANADPDWTRGALVGATADKRLVIRHIEGVRATSGGVEELMQNLAAQDGQGVKIALWQDPGQAGKSQIRALRNLLRGYAVDARPASRDKVTYAGIWSPMVERGEVSIVRGPWNEDFLREAEGFPDAKHDDQVDAVSLAAITLDARWKQPRTRLVHVRGL